MISQIVRNSAWRRLLDLLLISAGFAAALILYNSLFESGLSTAETLLGACTSILAFWLAIQLKDWGTAETDANWVVIVEQFCFGAGVNLLLHALMTYAFQIRRTPFLIVTGSFFSAVLLGAARRWGFLRTRSQSRVLLVGFDSVTASIVNSLRQPVIGLIGAGQLPVNPEIPLLGGIEHLEAAIEKFRPTHLFVSLKNRDAHISPSLLLECRLAGMVVQETQAVYESQFGRVCCERLQPVDILLSASLRGDSRTMAIQAVYTNLIALSFLLALAPLLLVISVAIAVFSGRGPVFENIECAGFQYIPFRLLRFRTTSRDGKTTAVGRVLERLRLVNLPQLINIVRGDMALVGPSPVRREFAGYLTGVMPFYSHRFSVKPGIMGWGRMHAARHHIADEYRQAEYDLYYIKEGSLWLDIEILTGVLLGGGKYWREGAR